MNLLSSQHSIRWSPASAKLIGKSYYKHTNWVFSAKYIAEGYTFKLDSIALRPFKAQGSLAFREQCLQWRRKRVASAERACQQRSVSPFACGSRVTSRDSFKCRACSHAETIKRWLLIIYLNVSIGATARIQVMRILWLVPADSLSDLSVQCLAIPKSKSKAILSESGLSRLSRKSWGLKNERTSDCKSQMNDVYLLIW